MLTKLSCQISCYRSALCNRSSIDFENWQMTIRSFWNKFLEKWHLVSTLILTSDSSHFSSFWRWNIVEIVFKDIEIMSKMLETLVLIRKWHSWITYKSSLLDFLVFHSSFVILSSSNSRFAVMKIWTSSFVFIFKIVFTWRIASPRPKKSKYVNL